MDAEGRRHNLGLHPTRAAATAALERRRRALAAAALDQEARRRVTRTRRTPVRDEQWLAPAGLALLLAYDPATGALVPRDTGEAAMNMALLPGRPPRVLARVRWRHLEVYAHRAAWCLAHGAWPRGRVRPADGDYGNLRAANLLCEAGEERAEPQYGDAQGRSS